MSSRSQPTGGPASASPVSKPLHRAVCPLKTSRACVWTRRPAAWCCSTSSTAPSHPASSTATPGAPRRRRASSTLGGATPPCACATTARAPSAPSGCCPSASGSRSSGRTCGPVLGTCARRTTSSTCSSRADSSPAGATWPRAGTGTPRLPVLLMRMPSRGDPCRCCGASGWKMSSTSGRALVCPWARRSGDSPLRRRLIWV